MFLVRSQQTNERSVVVGVKWHILDANRTKKERHKIEGGEGKSEAVTECPDILEVLKPWRWAGSFDWSGPSANWCGRHGPAAPWSAPSASEEPSTETGCRGCGIISPPHWAAVQWQASQPFFLKMAGKSRRRNVQFSKKSTQLVVSQRSPYIKNDSYVGSKSENKTLLRTS